MRISDWSSDVCSSDLSKFKASPTSINRECVGQYSSNCGFFAGEITPKYSFNMRATAQIDDFGDISLLWRWLDGADYERILDPDGIEPEDRQSVGRERGCQYG